MVNIKWRTLQVSLVLPSAVCLDFHTLLQYRWQIPFPVRWRWETRIVAVAAKHGDPLFSAENETISSFSSILPSANSENGRCDGSDREWWRDEDSQVSSLDAWSCICVAMIHSIITSLISRHPLLEFCRMLTNNWKCWTNVALSFWLTSGTDNS